ncbi:hypothetical protein [Lacunimicrobium album]
MNDVQISLTNDEALILFEWLSQFDATRLATDADQVAKAVLSKIEGQIESTLVEILLPDYADRLAAARTRLLEGK